MRYFNVIYSGKFEQEQKNSESSSYIYVKLKAP